MNCDNPKCRNPTICLVNCNKCGGKLCSNNCMIEHFFEIHQKLEKNNQEKKLLPFLKRELSTKEKSLFIKKGDFLYDVKIDPLFDFENLEFIKIGKKKQVLGTGAFGAVYLAKNKVNGNYYAVKHMYKKKIMEHGAKLEIVQREIDIHKRLIHENIIRMYSSYEDKNSFYLVI